ncbi:MFS transporter [Glutamicibacter sp. JC586]|uniref:MFS transporter n=1 Tax=Glutamicibacter sp. JC586 TaxID=2590552 RepID=UPI0013582C3F|nr:MFS transporter [Glutamicibacter sp. JC586]
MDSPQSTKNVAADVTSQALLPPLHKQRNYRMWLAADTSALLSGSIYGFVFPLILLATTSSPALAGILAAIGMIARASLILAGGSKADRSNKARMMLMGGICGAIITAAMALGSLTGSIPIALLCIAHVLMELRGGYFGSITNAALKDLVHPKQLGRAMAANQGRDSVLMLGSAPLGGLLLGLGGGLALATVSVFNAIAAFTGYALRRPLKVAADLSQDDHNDTEASREKVGHGVLAGMRWCFSRPQLRALLILITIVNIGVNGLMTTMIYGLQQRSETPWVIGLTSTFMGVGMLIGSLIATKLIDKFRSGLLTCICLSILGMAMLLIGFNTNLLWMGAMLMVSFLSVPALNAAVGGYFMACVPKEMSGRANSLITFMALAALPLAPLVTGFGLEWVGMGPTLIFFGAFVMISALLAWSTPLVRNIPHPDMWDKAEATQSQAALDK